MPADPIPEWARRAAEKWSPELRVFGATVECMAYEIARVLGPEMARLERERDEARDDAERNREAWCATAEEFLVRAMAAEKRAARWKQAAKRLRVWAPTLQRWEAEERARKARGEE